MKILPGLLGCLAMLSRSALAELQPVGNGSGFFITTDGYFITNNHVVAGADGLEVKVGDKAYPARVVKLDPQNDVAVLKLEGTFPCLALGADMETRPGDDVFTVGFPMADLMGAAPKTTIGIVSAVSGAQDDPRAFQISVQIQPGNSGGPLALKSTGNVIGITSATLNGKVLGGDGPAPQNVNYAMKASYIRPLLATVPGLLDKLPAAPKEERPFREIQKATEESIGLVIIYKDAAAQQPQPQGNPQPQPQAQGPWMFADSSERRLSRNDLAGFNADQLWVARNEIYARNGLLFSSAKGKAFAATLGPSYRGTDGDQDRVFRRMNKIEQANVELIKSLEPRR